ncbi:hypothetical protein U1707_06860 [Sphingomonas sp. PB2P12]|uniref:hypothetical protein n=1 Tax=Sphingomonas sandaracina TaxID=3096157 RepID=UPI002FC94C7D
MKSPDHIIERLAVICRLLNESRDIADAEHEFMLGAKLDDCLLCAEERIATLEG